MVAWTHADLSLYSHGHERCRAEVCLCLVLSQIQQCLTHNAREEINIILSFKRIKKCWMFNDRMMLCSKYESDASQKPIFLKYMFPRCCNDNIDILEPTQRFTVTIRRQLGPPNINDYLKLVWSKYCKNSFENRFRGTWVIHFRVLMTPSRGVETHSTLNIRWTTLIYTTRPFTHLYIHICKVAKKEFWKLTERNVSYSR
jgi:hypothetical protein